MHRHADGPNDHEAEPRRADGGLSPQRVLIALALLLLVAFAVANFKSVEVSFLLFTTRARVVTVIVVAGLLGFVAGYLVGRPSRTQRKRLRAEGDKG